MAKKELYYIDGNHHLAGQPFLVDEDYVINPNDPMTFIAQPNDSNKVYFDWDTQTWIEEPKKSIEPTTQDKMNAQILATLASDKTAQSKFNAQVLLQLASKTTKEVQA